MRNSSLQLDLAFIDHTFVIMNSPARMGAAGINTCGKPFSSVKASKDHSLIPSFSPPRSHTSHSLFLTPPFPLQRVVTSKGRDSGRTERERGNLKRGLYFSWFFFALLFIVLFRKELFKFVNRGDFIFRIIFP